MVTNRRMVDFDGADFYPTPSWATQALLSEETFSNTILEPCCGDGAISKVLTAAGHNVISTDKYDRGYGLLRDVFDYGEKDQVFNVITNPPFAIAEEIVLKFLSLYQNKMCFLLRTAFLESVKRYETIFETHPPSRVYVFSQRLSMYPAGQKGVKGGGTTSYAWFVWDKQNCSTPELRWIKPGFKNKMEIVDQ